jgi:protoporphyrinogen oxidase
MANRKVIVIGGGPAGLTAAYELSRSGVRSIVLEADDTVGGLARTVNYKGYLFDIGGHRFFTKWDEVQKIWQEVLGDSFKERSRLSRIYYRNKFFFYPLRPANALAGLGLWESVRILSSYVHAHLSPESTEETFEQWVTKRFGKRLYEIFFKTYTEKVWGIPCTEIRAEWAAQRIKSLSLGAAVRQAVFRKNTSSIKSLIDRFHYPDYGPGQMWESLAQKLHTDGSHVALQSPVVRVRHKAKRVTQVVVRNNEGTTEYEGTDFISSMPIRNLIAALDPEPNEKVRTAAASLKYRDFLIVSLILRRRHVMSDNWIYIHDPKVRVGRIQNFKNWSPSMVPDPSMTCLGMEYFVTENDDFWKSADQELIEIAKRELAYLGLASPEEIEDGTVVRVPKAYPVYDSRWAEHVSTIRRYLEANFENLQLIGRNGMHKYNNQDHSMMTALYAARNILGANYDLWAVNNEPEYHEQDVQRLASRIEPKAAGLPGLNAESTFEG